MRRRLLAAPVALAAAVLGLAFAQSAYAFPTQGNQCSNCHGGPNVPVTTALVTNDGTKATYSVSAPGAYAIAVFNGGTKLATINAASGTFTVADGGTYTVFAVQGPSTGDGLGVASVSPVAPPPPAPADTTAPSTVSDAKASYADAAAVTLTATDAGSGVAATYYKLDGGAQTTGTAIAVTGAGSHAIEFWSVDKAGNVEMPHKTAVFTITVTPPPPAVDLLAPATVSDAKPAYITSASIKLTAVDNAGGTGVAHTYYRLDGGSQAEGTLVSVTATGTHTLEFWSVDAAGNVEMPHGFATFTVAAPAPAPVPDGTAATKVTIRAQRSHEHGRRALRLTGTLAPAASGDVVTVYVRKSGSSEWVAAGSGTVRRVESDEHEGDGEREAAQAASQWSVRYRPAGRGTWEVQARFAGDATRAAGVSPTLKVTLR